MTWQEEKGMKRTIDDDGTVRYDGQVAIQESIQNKLFLRERRNEMKGIRKNRNELKEIFDCGRLRQILERGDLSRTETDMVIDAVSEKYKY